MPTNISSSYLWPLSSERSSGINHFHKIYFTENNFGPFAVWTYHFRNIRTRILNTIYRVLFSSLCLQIFIFYFGILKINTYIFSAAYKSDQNKTFYRSKYFQWQWFARAFSLRSRRYSRARENGKIEIIWFSLYYYYYYFKIF
jgi:hypothetical protein